MTFGKLSLPFAVCCAAATPAMAGEEIQFGPAPGWVEVAAQLPVPAAENDLPARLVLMDNQVRFEEGGQSTYTAMAVKFQTPEGLAGGNLSFAWRPETQDLTVHKVLIHRGDETIDVLASGQTFTVLRREQNLELAMLDGTLTASMFPEGLQVGDILEFATTVTDRDPVTAGHADVGAGPFNFPVDRLTFKVEWPEGRQVNLARTEDLPAWRRSRKDGVETAEFSLDHLEMAAVPRLAPLRYSIIRFAEASDYRSWADVAAVEVPLYAKAAKVPATGPLRDEVERIRESSTDPVARAEAALKLVQGRIRYVALVMGSGGLTPVDAEQTWARRYGDCKAKTALLLAILGELGIEAQGVAVNTEAGDILSQRIPSMSLFNHILVRAQIGGRDYWLDGTRTGDTSLANLQIPNFGWGLPVVRDAKLIPIVPPPLDKPAYDIAINMDASKGVRAPVPTRIELTYRGDTALGVNQGIAGLVGEARDRTLREFWRRQFNFITPDKVSSEYNQAAQELKLILEGQATLDWNGDWYETDQTGLGYKADFSREAGLNQDAPFLVGHPFYTRTRQTITLPPGFAGPTDKDANVDETVAGVEYKRTTSFSGNTVVIEATERSVASEFAAADAPKFQKRLRELADNGVFLKIPAGYRATAADLDVLVRSEGGSHADLISEGLQLLEAGRLGDAADRFRRATELDPQDAWGWANLGVALAQQRKTDEAEKALDRAEAIDPQNKVIFNGRGILAENRGDFDAAAAAFTKALELDPQNGFAQSNRVYAWLNAGKIDQGLEELAAEARKDPHQLQTYISQAGLLLLARRGDEVPRVLEALLAANKDNPAARQMAAHLYAEIGMADKAQELAGGDTPVTPSPMFYFNRAGGRAPGDAEGQLADLGEALRVDPAFEPALVARAQVLQNLGRSEEALADTAEVLRRNPQRSDVYLLRANILNSTGRQEAAIKEAEALVAASPEEAFAHVAAAKIYSNFGMNAEAMAEMDRALAIAPEAYIYINRSQVRDKGDVEGRLADLDEALRLSPGETTALYMKADLLEKKGDYAAALAAMELTGESKPDDLGLLNNRGVILARAGRTEEAEESFAAARQLAADAASLNGLCYGKAVANVALERALEECEASLKLRPDYAPVLDSRGAVLLRLGRLDEALRDFDRALELSPGLNNSRYLRAVTRSQKGDMAGARQDLEAVRASSPDLIASMEEEGFVVVETK